MSTTSAFFPLNFCSKLFTRHLIGVWILSVFIPLPVFAGNYSTSISPAGAQISNPITATFNIQNFAEKDYDTEGLCETGFIPGEMTFTYWFNEQDFNTMPPAVIPTSEMIATGIYSATFNLSPGQSVYSIGVEFSQNTGGGGTKCIFRGNQPNGVVLDEWSQPIFTVVNTEIRVFIPQQSRAPLVSFVDFPTEKIWSGKKVITYAATDSDRPPFGLKDLPISFYLSNDGGTIWKELAKDESNKGVYSFNTNNFPDGVNYKLKIVALDNDNKSGEVVSGIFSIDNTPPSFIVSIKEAFIKEKDKIHVEITSSENLMEVPTVRITQSGAEPQSLIIDGFGKKFSGVFTILKGYLGAALIFITGKDVAGNTGEKITSGETFIVSRFGPPPPIVKNIVDNESFSAPDIAVFGSAPSAREVVFVFNEKDKRTVVPQDNGDFSFKDIVLISANYGRNTLSFFSIGKDGIESDIKTLTVKLNRPPKISWVSVPQGTVSEKTKLEWTASDVNNDELVFSLLYSTDGGKSWDFVSKGLLAHQYELNTAEFFDGGNIRIKVIVDDGTVVSEIVSEAVIFKNNNLFSVNIPKNYTFDTVRPVMKGDVRVPENNIVSLKYSLEKEVWVNAESVDGVFDSSFEKFSIKFPEQFVDGKQTLFIDAKNAVGKSIKTFQYFIIDTLPPVASKIDFPVSNETINSSHDRDPKLGGIQIDVSGKAEAGSDLELMANSRVYTTSADRNGNFVFKNATFLSRGINRYVLSSFDAVGNISKIEGFILSNNAPKLSLLAPQKGDFLQGIKEVKWRALDEDDDTLVFQVSYRRKGDKNWISAEPNLTSRSYAWNVSKLKDGAYELQVGVNDGLTEVSVVEDISIDNTQPTIHFDVANGPLPVSKVRLFSGSAEDNFSGIKFVEYSIDGKSWFKALIADGYLQKKSSFVIRHPFEFEEGEYDFGVRAVDAAGNISKPVFEKIIVDSTPPRIGSFVISHKNITIFPTDDFFEVPETVPLHFTVSLERDTQSAAVSFGTHTFDLVKNKSTDLWEVDFSAGAQGTSTISITARDFLENKVDNEIVGEIKMTPRGRTVPGAKMTVFLRREDQSLAVWPAGVYGMSNPVWSDKNGEYTLLLPSGKYQILVEKSGYQRLRISDFEISTTRFISFDSSLKPRSGIRGFFEDVLEKLTL